MLAKIASKISPSISNNPTLKTTQIRKPIAKPNQIWLKIKPIKNPKIVHIVKEIIMFYLPMICNKTFATNSLVSCLLLFNTSK